MKVLVSEEEEGGGRRKRVSDISTMAGRNGAME